MPEEATLTADQKKLLDTGTLIHKLAGDPKHRKEVLKLLKVADPDLVIPELDLADRMQEEIDARVKPTTDTLDGLRKDVTALTAAISRDRFKSQHGLNDEELVDVETLAKEHKIGDGAFAVETWRMRRDVLGTPRTTGMQSVEMTKEERKELLTKPKSWAMKKANQVLRELRGGRLAS